MNAELKAKWVAKLRSGNLKQARGILRSDSGAYCCLGVLCTLDVEFSDWDRYSQSVSPAPVIAAGLYGPEFPSQALQLAQMNDEGKTFAEIADYIETHL